MQEKLSKKSLGLRIKLLRTERAFTQDFIAKILDISRSNYSQIELGNQYPTLDTIGLIASYYNKSYDWILHGKDTSESTQQVTEIFKELPPATIPERKDIILVTQGLDYITQINSISYLSKLPAFSLPVSFMNSPACFRAFSVRHDMILKYIYPGDVLIGRQLNNFSLLALNETYIIVTFSEIHFCKIESIIGERKLLSCKNDQPNNSNFTLLFDEIQEIWLAVCKYSTIIQPTMETLENSIQSLEKLIHKLEVKVSYLNEKVK